MTACLGRAETSELKIGLSRLIRSIQSLSGLLLCLRLRTGPRRGAGQGLAQRRVVSAVDVASGGLLGRAEYTAEGRGTTYDNHNNIAEQHLRLIALARKNFPFVGNDEAGRNLATLQTLVSTCLANDINPQSYLTDVLLRMQDHPQSRIAELLPWNWKVEPRSQ